MFLAFPPLHNEGGFFALGFVEEGYLGIYMR